MIDDELASILDEGCEINESHWHQSDDGMVHVEGDFIVPILLLLDGRLRIGFGSVSGDFIMDGMGDLLTSLEGSPKKVEGAFDCSGSAIKDLRHAPSDAMWFSCSDCYNLTSLEGSPKTVFNFDCHGCDELKSLEGGPDEADTYCCSFCSSLTSLEGMPAMLNSTLDADHNDRLASLKGISRTIGERLLLDVRCCPCLQSLEHMPDVLEKCDIKVDERLFKDPVYRRWSLLKKLESL